MSWNSFKNEFGRASDDLSDAINTISNRNYALNVNANPHDGFSVELSSSPVMSVPLIIGLVVGGGVLILLIALCCCCCKRSTRGRVLLPPAANPPPAPAPYLVHIQHSGVPVGVGGTGLYPVVGPMTHAPVPAATVCEMGATSAVTPDYPPSYDTDRLLHPEVKSRP